MLATKESYKARTEPWDDPFWEDQRQILLDEAEKYVKDRLGIKDWAEVAERADRR